KKSADYLIQFSRSDTRRHFFYSQALRLLDDFVEFLQLGMGRPEEKDAGQVARVPSEKRSCVDENEVSFPEAALPCSMVRMGAIWAKGDDRLKRKGRRPFSFAEDLELQSELPFGDPLLEKGADVRNSCARQKGSPFQRFDLLRALFRSQRLQR